MEYNGIKLKEVTESQIVDPPKKMLVWDCDPGNVYKTDVLAIVKGRESDYPCDYDNRSFPSLCGDS